MVENKFVDAETEEIISQLAQVETGKKQYYRPVYSLHKWWARRPGTLFRAIILQAIEPHKKLFSINHGSLSPESNYFQSHNLENVIIFDPFMGGGTTLVEANRLGAKVIGCDLNPVSCWIVRETLKPIDLDKLNHYFARLDQTVGVKIRSLYSTNCVRCNTVAEGLYAFWIRYVNCMHCGQNVYLFKRTMLNKGESRNKSISRTNLATVFCPNCFGLNDWNGKDECECKDCGSRFDPKDGTYNQGNYICSKCGKEGISLIGTINKGHRLHERLIAIEYWCPTCQKRLYKNPDEKDLAKIQEIEEDFIRLGEKGIYPKQKILVGDSSVRWRRHHYYHYYDLFNHRQLLAFNYLIEAIFDIPEEEYRNAFITIFSNSLEYNNMMTPYNYPHRKLHHLFNYHALPLTTTPVENSVWGVGEEGAGTFVNCYRRYFQAKKYCQKPFEKFKYDNNSVHTVWTKNERINANYVFSFEELKKTPRGVLLFCGDSAHLPQIPNNSVDFIITDPPYFDNIHYSELSNFFYVWLKALLPDNPYFNSDHVPTEKEAIVNVDMNKGEKEYRNLLISVFTECKRMLKDEGSLIFTFHHTKRIAWWTLLRTILESGFKIIDYFPVVSEYKVNPHIRNKQSLNMDLVLVCKKSDVAHIHRTLDVSDIFNQVTKKLSLDHSNINDNRVFLHFIGDLLVALCATTDSNDLNYEWFDKALDYFENELGKIKQKDRTIANVNSTGYKQLRLFEPDSDYH